MKANCKSNETNWEECRNISMEMWKMVKKWRFLIQKDYENHYNFEKRKNVFLANKKKNIIKKIVGGSFSNWTN